MSGSDNSEIWNFSENNCHVALTNDHLNIQSVIDQVRSPSAGAIVLFAGKYYSQAYPKLHSLLAHSILTTT